MALLLGVLSFLLPAEAVAPAPPVRTCEQRIEAGDGPIPFPAARSGSVFAGPLAFAGSFPRTPAALGPRGADGRYWVKVGALLRAGRPVVLSVPSRYRGVFVTHYDRDDDDGEATVRIEPCPPSTPAFSYDGRVGPVTAFSGGFGVSRAGCYPLDVRVVGGRSHRVRLALGRPCR